MTKLLPNVSTLTDDPLVTSAFPTVGDGYLITAQLVARSAHPEVGNLVPRAGRYSSSGLCEHCLEHPSHPAQDGGHPYRPIVNRVPGTHPAVDDGRVHNFQPGVDSPGDQMLQVHDADLQPGGAAEAGFRAKSARQLPGAWPRPDPRERPIG